MQVWITVLLMAMLIPVITLLIGILAKNNIPRRINWFWGYRTQLSMKNADTWQFANACMGKILVPGGVILLLLVPVAMLFLLGKSDDTVATFGAMIMCAGMLPVLAVIPYTEKKLRQTFDKDGNRI